MLVDGTVDFSKAALAQFEDPPKKFQHAMTQLVQNLQWADKTVAIPHKDILHKAYIGEGGVKVPDNMTKMSNYFFNLQNKQFKTGGGKQEGGDALSSLKGNKKDTRAKTARFSMFVNSDVPTRELIEQVSFEWSRFGTYLGVKELQAISTDTPVLIHNLHNQTARHIIKAEVEKCLKLIQDDIDNDSHIYMHSDIPWDYVNSPVMDINIRSNVPTIPKQKATAISKMPRHLQNCRRITHLEVALEHVERLKFMVARGKKKGIFKEILGPHAHFTEVVNWESPDNDLKRADKFHKDSTNYNASMTSAEVHGFLDLDDKVALKQDGKVVQRVSGRVVLLSLLKLEDNSSLIGEVHQADANGVVLLVYPNIPEAESLITNLIKNPAAFLKFYLDDLGVDNVFVRDLIKKFCDPALIHETHNCKWDSEQKLLSTPEELEEEEDDKLVQQKWFVDIVAQYEEMQVKEGGKKSKNFASAAALYDLDAERSVKTMHEKNDGVENAEEMEEADGEKKKAIESDEVSSLGNGEKESVGGDVEEEGGLQKNVGEEIAPTNEQSGDTPRSGSVRFQVGEDDGAQGSDDSDVEDVTPRAAASAAEDQASPTEAGRSG